MPLTRKGLEAYIGILFLTGDPLLVFLDKCKNSTEMNNPLMVDWIQCSVCYGLQVIISLANRFR